MQIINTTNLNQARKQIQLAKKNKQQVIVQAQDDAFNRKILENSEVEILLSPESHNRKDFMKQRDSGLNEIHAKLAKQNNIKIGIDLSKIKSLDKRQKAIILSRIKQNIDLCKRTKTQIILLNTGSKQDAMSFMQALGSSTQQAKQSTKL